MKKQKQIKQQRAIILLELAIRRLEGKITYEQHKQRENLINRAFCRVCEII